MYPSLPLPRPLASHPVRQIAQSLLALACAGAWLYWSLTHTVWVYGRLLAASDPQSTGLGLLIALLGTVFWVAGVAPYVTGFVLALILPMPRIKGMVVRPRAGVLRVDVLPGPHPVLIERVYLSAAQAQARGFDSPVIAERIHYTP